MLNEYSILYLREKIPHSWIRGRTYTKKKWKKEKKHKIKYYTMAILFRRCKNEQKYTMIFFPFSFSLSLWLIFILAFYHVHKTFFHSFYFFFHRFSQCVQREHFHNNFYLLVQHTHTYIQRSDTTICFNLHQFI